MPATEAAALIAAARRWPAPGPGRVSPLAPGSSHRLFAAVLAGERVVVKLFQNARRRWVCSAARAPRRPPHRSDDDGWPRSSCAGPPERSGPWRRWTTGSWRPWVRPHDRMRAAVPASRRRATGHPAALRARPARGRAAAGPGRGSGYTSARDDGEALGRCDPNAANYLWDGGEVTLVDFEASGLTVPAVDLADLAEHAANRGLLEATIDRLGDP